MKTSLGARKLIRPAVRAGAVMAAVLWVVVLGAEEPLQELPVAGLEARLETASDEERLEILHELAYRTSFVSVETGRRYGQEALALARQLDDLVGEAAAERNLAVAESVAGAHQTSLEHATRAAELYEQAGVQRGVASSLNVMGVCHRMMGNYDQALELYHRSLEIDRELDNLEGVARTLGNVANVHYDRGDFARAYEIHLEELEIVRQLGDERGISQALNNIGIAQYQMGDYDGALESLLVSLEKDEAAGDEGGVASSCANIGNIFMDMDQLDRALEYFQRAQKLYAKVGNLSGVAGTHTNIGNVYQLMQRYDEAEAEYRKVLAYAREQESKWDIAATLDNIGVVNRDRGDLEAALELHRQALAMWEELDVRDGVARSSQNIGRALKLSGRRRDATEYLVRAVQIAETLDDTDRLHQANGLLAEVREELGDYKGALEAFRAATNAREIKLNERSNRRVQELEARYQAEKKQREIDLLEAQNEVERLRTSRAHLRANLILGGLGGVLLLVGWLGYRYRTLLAFWRRSSQIGSYRLKDRLAAGGMGVVYRAESLGGGSRPVALKVIRDELAADATVRRRFLHEAAVIDQLDDPHVVRVHERGEHDGRLFIAMELLEGRSLAERLATSDPVPFAEALRIIAQLLATTERLHSKGILHRDLKPENVFLVSQDDDPTFVKLLDFGLARTQTLTRLTQTGMLIGTIAYLAPEVITEQRFSAASDLYAVGVIAYELVTNRPAFPGETPVEIIKQVLDVTPVEPIRYRPEIPLELDELVMSMLAKRPQDRPSETDARARITELTIVREETVS